LHPTSGKLSVLGHDPGRDPSAVHAVCGLLTETAQMVPTLTARENLLFFAQLYGMQDKAARERAEELLSLLEIADAKGKVKTFSTGMTKRLNLARVLMHRPRVLFLDEPTSGLDPESALMVTELIRKQAEEGAAVFLCTHQLRYAEGICHGYGLLSEGKLIASGNLEELRYRAGDPLKIRVTGNVPEEILPQVKDGIYEKEIMGREAVTPLLRRILEAGGRIYEVTLPRMSLEDVYFNLVDMKEELHA